MTTSQWVSFTPKSVIYHEILLSDVILLSYQVFWYFAWDVCQSHHPVVSWIIMFLFSEDHHIAAVFQSFGFPQCSEINYTLMSAVMKSIWHKKVNDHDPHLPFCSNSVPFSPSCPSPEAPQSCKPCLLCWRGGRLLRWVRLHCPSNRGRASEGSQVLQREGERKAQLSWAAEFCPHNFFQLLILLWGW